MKKIRLSQPVFLSSMLIAAYLLFYKTNFTNGINDAFVDLLDAFK